MHRNLELVQGVTEVITVYARDDSGTAIDLTGLTGNNILFRIAREYSATTADVTLNLSSGIALTTPASGLFTITIPAATISPLYGDYVYDCIVTKSGVTTRQLWGKCTVDEAIG